MKEPHRPLYAVNITGRTSQLKDRAKQAIDLGAPALLLNVFAYGLDVLQDLREDTEIDVPILAHPAVSGAMTSSAYYGFSHQLLLGKLLRMAGADLVLFPSPYGNVALEKDKVLGIVTSLTEQDDSYKKAFPVPSMRRIISAPANPTDSVQIVANTYLFNVSYLLVYVV